MIIIAALIILTVSVILAIRAAHKELSVPEEVKRIKVPRGGRLYGVVVFLKNKVLHYSSAPKSS